MAAVVATLQAPTHILVIPKKPISGEPLGSSASQFLDAGADSGWAQALRKRRMATLLCSGTC